MQLIIEIDGVTDNGKQSYDKRRENRLRELGFNVLRHDGYYVLKNITGALEWIMGFIEEIGKRHPPQSPLNRGAGSDFPLWKGARGMFFKPFKIKS